MSLIIILLAVFLTTLRSGALICYHRRPILLLVPQSRKRGYAPADRRISGIAVVCVRHGEDGQQARSGAAHAAMYRQLSRPQGSSERNDRRLVGGTRWRHAHSSRLPPQTAQSLEGLPYSHLHRRTYPIR